MLYDKKMPSLKDKIIKEVKVLKSVKPLKEKKVRGKKSGGGRTASKKLKGKK